MVAIFLSAFILMIALACAVFFAVVQGQEKVMVPDVTGKQLTEALIEMQEKELYPKIQLRYSDSTSDAGKILEQNPSSGAIVKAGRRISLVVSRGAIIDHVEDYVGQKLDDVKMQLQTLFAGSANPLIILAEPVYKADVAEPGTILEQTPAPDTIITEPVSVSLIVSRGPQFDNTRVPKLTGRNIESMLSFMPSSKIVYDFTNHTVEGKQKVGTITAQQSFDEEFISNYTRMSVDFAFPEGNTDEEGNIYGIFTDSITNYPYPVPMRVDVISPEGETSTLISFNHPGGEFSVPYKVQKGSVLILYVVDKEHKRINVD
ncbi:MAG: PASTA domain-containing protein [Treponema sp.]|nr:PASTA domain-containing protein [Treponema sp.]